MEVLIKRKYISKKDRSIYVGGGGALPRSIKKDGCRMEECGIRKTHRPKYMIEISEAGTKAYLAAFTGKVLATISPPRSIEYNEHSIVEKKGEIEGESRRYSNRQLGSRTHLCPCKKRMDKVEKG